MPVTLRGGAGDDYLDLGFVQKNLDLINSTITLEGGTGYDRAFIYDNLDSSADTFTLTATTFDSSGTFGLMTYTGVEEVNPTTGTGADVVDIYASNAGVKMYVNSSGGTDTVNVGKGTASGGTRGILGDIDIQNSPSFTTVNFDDDGDTIGRSITSGTFGGIGNPFGYVAGLTLGTVFYKYADVSGINVNLGRGNDIVSIYETFKPIAFIGSNYQQRTGSPWAVRRRAERYPRQLAADCARLRRQRCGGRQPQRRRTRQRRVAQGAANEYVLSGFTGGGIHHL